MTGLDRSWCFQSNDRRRVTREFAIVPWTDDCRVKALGNLNGSFGKLRARRPGWLVARCLAWWAAARWCGSRLLLPAGCYLRLAIGAVANEVDRDPLGQRWNVTDRSTDPRDSSMPVPYELDCWERN